MTLMLQWKNDTSHQVLVLTRAVDPEPTQFWMAGAGATKINMVEPKPDI